MPFDFDHMHRRRAWYRRQKTIYGALLAVTILVIYKTWVLYSSTAPEVAERRCPEPEIALIQTDLETLLDVLKDPNDRQAYAWMRMRSRRMWPKWVQATKAYIKRTRLLGRTRKKILVFIGALTQESRRNLAERQFKGGYLGELIQWSDLISGLYLLGHDVTVISETDQLRGLEHFFVEGTDKCDRMGAHSPILYTDIFGVRHIRKIIKMKYNIYKCKLRVLDVFGTDPAYNDKMYAYKHNRTSFWGGLDLSTQQLYTMYPENPDNSFLGFAVDTDFSPGQEVEKDFTALVYGKSPDAWKGKSQYLRVFDEAGFNLYATVKVDDSHHPDTSDIPSFVNNLGIINSDALKTLLIRSRVFIGLGSPIEGPAPMEALAHGAVYINPQLEGNVSLTDRMRVTERMLTSQTPYTETSIGEPHVYTVPIENLDRIKKIAEKLMKQSRFMTVLPYEFSPEGFIQRLNVFLEKQDFCQEDELKRWPPDESVTSYHTGDPGKSCTQVCKDIGLVCEPSHFVKANTIARFQKDSREPNVCDASRLASDIYFPAVETGPNYCILQRNRNLFSCAGSSRLYQRLCPCRNYMAGQRALCKHCDF